MSLLIHSSTSLCDHLFPQALLTLFVFSTKDGWVTIMYDGIDAVGIDKQVSSHFCFAKLLTTYIIYCYEWN